MKSLKEQLVGNSREIKETRVNNFINILRDQSENMINNLGNSKMEYRKLQMKLESLVDIAPTNAMDLGSKLSSIDTAKLMNDINDVVRDMYNTAIIIERKVALHNRLFPDYKINGLGDDELDFLKDIVHSNLGKTKQEDKK
jgi:hypothetical protein